MSMNEMNNINSSRRNAMKSAACGFGYLAFAGLAGRQAGATPANPLTAKRPMFAPKAKRVIFIFMQGGVSQVDSYDPKPQLDKYDGQKVEFFNARIRQRREEPVMKSLWGFKKHGQSGRQVSELFPHMAKHVDDYCVIRGMHTEGVAHGPATLFLHTGATNLIRPSVGSWVNYGLGSENENLPGFITIHPSAAKGGPRNYSNAFLPAAHQGTTIGRAGLPMTEAGIKYLSNDFSSGSAQRKQFQFLQSLNRVQAENHGGDPNVEAAISSYELAYRMQSAAPEVMNLESENAKTLEMYGIGEQPTDNFGRQCLMARRFAEQGVRYIQVSYSDNGANPPWDQHSNMPKHKEHALASDKPVAGLLQDLKQRGLLEDTLVWWGGEFGRTPFSQGNNGRDHNPKGFSVWLAGGGIKPGIVHGETDEWGYEAVQGKVHMHDLHATILHQLGMDHEKLTYRFAGRDFRLTDVYGHVVKDIIA
jgi:hypothetical protein